MNSDRARELLTAELEQLARAPDPVSRPVPAPPYVDPVEQPYGRAPQARHPGG